MVEMDADFDDWLKERSTSELLSRKTSWPTSLTIFSLEMRTKKWKVQRQK